MNPEAEKPVRIFFIEMMGVPGSYDASVYDHCEDRCDEGQWFVKRYAHVPGITIADDNCFHYANSEQIANIPPGSSLLASSSKLPVAALDFGDHCYTTQFHPEATEQTLGTIWQHKVPELMLNYHTRDNGDQLVENFLGLVNKLTS